MADKVKAAKIVTPEFRVSFPSVFEKSGFAGSTPKYSVVALFPAGTDLSAMKALIMPAALAKFGSKMDDPEFKKTLKSPFRDGSEKPEMDGYAGVTFCTMSSYTQRPGVVDANVQPIMDAGDLYGGCYAKASITAYGYDKAGNRGVAFGLQNLQKLRDGDPFSGRSNPEDDFQAVTDVTGDSAEGVTAGSDDVFG